MSLRIISLESFEKDVKLLAKKYNKLASDLKLLGETLSQNPKAGAALSSRLYKLRLQNSSTQSGKSGGFRVIYYYMDAQENIYLMKMYSKTDVQNITKDMLLEILKNSGLKDD